MMIKKEKTDIELYSYVVAKDRGFAPNPYGGLCTLACCKPVIRRKAKCGDWIVGLGSVTRKADECIIYAMRITEDPLTCEKYFGNKKYRKRNDSIYFLSRGKWKIRDNPYGHITQKNRKYDFNGKNVLLSKHFYYFGHLKERLPGQFSIINLKPNNARKGHRVFEYGQVNKFIGWLERKHDHGRLGNPLDPLHKGCGEFRGHIT